MKPILIAIAGGTASGKTTVVKEMMQYMNHDEITVICMDNYYKERNDLSLEERKKINYDHPDSFDMDRLSRDLDKLLNQQTIHCPVYNFCEHNRDAHQVIEVHPTKVIILEGILALYDPKIRALASISIFVESEPDIRFIRRLKRDIVERGRTMDNVISQYLDTVKPMFDAYVAPTKRYADIIIPNDTKHDVAIEIFCAKIKEIVK